MRPYTIEEIKQRITPVAEKYGLAAVYLFGSYARGEASAESDIDLLVDTDITGLNFYGLVEELRVELKKEVDKCILVCSNCHAEIHEELDNKNRNITNI